MFGVIERAVGF